jgi:hypothetical protein
MFNGIEQSCERIDKNKNMIIQPRLEDELKKDKNNQFDHNLSQLLQLEA